MKLLSKIFPSKHEKDVKAILPIVEEINKYYEEYQELSDEELIEYIVSEGTLYYRVSPAGMRGN